jgi:hypothetical protein
MDPPKDMLGSLELEVVNKVLMFQLVVVARAGVVP